MLNRRTERLTLAGFAFSLVAMAILSLLSLHQARTFANSASALARSQEIMRSLASLRAGVSGAETSQRGYLITGSAVYLENYRRQWHEATLELQHLAGLTAGDARQSSLADALSGQIARRFEIFEGVIAVYRTGGFAAAKALIAEDAGRRQSERIHATLGELDRILQDGVRALEQEQQATKTRLQYSIMTLAIVLLFVLSLIYVQVRRSTATARRAEQLLSRLNLQLEASVAERTAELEVRTRELEQRTRELEQQKLQLENKTAQLESFSFSVSHDLRAPLRAISGFAQILARRHGGELSAQGRHFLDNIVQASSHMGRLIDDLLNYSRIGRKALALKPVALGEVLSEIAGLLQPRIAETGATVHIAGNLPAVQADRTLLAQVFTNLIDNALTYRKPGVPPVISVTCREQDESLIVSVSDNGIGIAPEHFEKIFNVFQRLHTQEEFPGTGIGLAVVRKAVELQDGRVWVESTPGAGSTFHVQLPRSAAAHEVPHEMHKAKAACRSDRLQGARA